MTRGPNRSHSGNHHAHRENQKKFRKTMMTRCIRPPPPEIRMLNLTNVNGHILHLQPLRA